MVKNTQISIIYVDADFRISEDLSTNLKYSFPNFFIQIFSLSQLPKIISNDELSKLIDDLSHSEIILLLVSNKYLVEADLQFKMSIFRAPQKLGNIIIPIILEECSWQDIIYKQFQILPSNFISIFNKENDNVRYKTIENKILEIIDTNFYKDGYKIALYRIKECAENKSTILDLSNLGLTELPEEITQLKNHLEYLRIGNNYYDNETKQFVFSKEDRFGLNKIKALAFLDGFTGLKGLYAANNEIESSFYTSALFNSFKNLEHLDLYANKMSLPIGFILPQKLIALDISYNKVVDLFTLKSMYQLEQLDIEFVEGFDVRDLEYIPRPEKLKLLNIKSNNILDDKPIHRFRKIEDLNIENNLIKSISFIEKLPKLKQIKLSNNPINDCPPDVYESNDINQIRAFFDQKRNENSTFISVDELINKVKEKRIINQQTLSSKKDIKLILLGNSNAGKTNLVHYLKTNKFLKKRNSTHGLEVVRWQPDANRFPSLQDVEISIWDFGGQEYYHEAYRLFLSANAIYIVLWENDTNKNFKKEIAVVDNKPNEEIEFFEKKYWLDTVRFYGNDKNNAPLFLVQNKVDNIEKDKARIDEQLFLDYNISESFSISLSEGTNESNIRQQRILNDFVKELEFSIASIANSTTALPDAWQIIRKEIINIGHNQSNNAFAKFIEKEIFISTENFTTVCKKIINDIDDRAITTIISALNRGGTIVYFGENENLKDKVFVNPKALSEQIYSILNKNILQCNGEFTLDVNDELNKIFINVTKDLGLIFSHPTKEHYFIAPQYLPAVHAIEDLFVIASNNAWQDSFWIRMPLFFYKKLLNHLILHFINDVNTQAKYYWKHGIVFIQNNVRVLIKGLYPNEKESNGVILIAVEQGIGKINIQKSIFDIILKFNADANQNNNLNIPNGLQPINGNSFLENLEMSIDSNNNYYYYKEIDKNIIDANYQKETTIPISFLSKFSIISPNATIKAPKKIFISYSHNNTNWLSKLRTHLSGLKRSGKIEQWTDQEIQAGEIWDEKIKDAMKDADVFICLLTAEFVASDYSWNVEMNHMFKYKQEKNAKVIFVYIDPFDIGSIKEAKFNDDFTTATILDFEIIPKDESGHLKPASLWQNENNALATIVKRIREAIEE